MPSVPTAERAYGCDHIPPLLGHTIAVTGDRRAEELTSHLRSAGATVLRGPMLHTRPVVDDSGQLRASTEAVIARPPAWVLATTGIGVRAWINAAASWGLRNDLLRALGRSRLLARGPKVVGALSEAGLAVRTLEPTGRSMPLVEHLCRQPIAGTHVVVQLPGDAMPEAVARLEAAGAAVTTVAVYDWDWPADLGSARRLLRAVADGQVSAVTFTSRPAVRNFLALAVQEGLDAKVRRSLDAVRGTTIAACVGRATADELAGSSDARLALPDEPVLGLLVEAVIDGVHEIGHHHLRTPRGAEVVVQRRLVHTVEGAVTTSEREAALLQRLIAAGGGTVGRAALVRSVWGVGPIDHAVLETTMTRLRRRLATTALPVRTVNGRGYRLDADLVACGRSAS